MTAPGRTALAASLVLLLLLGWVGLRLEISTDISELLPTPEDQAQAHLSSAVVRGPLLQTAIVTIDGGHAERAARVSEAFEAAVRADPELMQDLRSFQAAPPSGIDQSIYELYHPRRSAFTGPTVATTERMLTDAGLVEVVAELQRRLQSPLSTLLTRIAPEDPFLALPRLMERLQRQRPAGIEVVDGRLVAQDRYAVFLVATRGSAFDAPAQRRVVQRLEDRFAAISGRFPDARLEMSSVGRFAIQAETTIKRDMQRTTLLSIAGLLTLGAVLFRSFRLVLLSMLPIGAGFVVASAASLLVFGSIHGLTLVFGASLIGVCIDYVAHFYVHHVLEPDPAGPSATLRRIWPGMAIGATTTIVGFLVMGGSSFPGLRQISLFASVGIAAALASTRWILPALVPTRPPAIDLRARLADRLLASLQWLRRRPRPAGLASLVALVLTVVGLTQVRWDDEVDGMNRLDPELLAEDERVRERVGRFEQGTFVVALGDTEEAALQVNDIVADTMQDAQVAGEVVAWQNIAALLPSARRQIRVDQTVRTASDLRTRLSAALFDAGFDPDAFAPFFEYLHAEPPRPLTFDDLALSEAASLVAPFRLSTGDQVGFLTFVRGVTSPAALRARLAPIHGAVYLDQADLIGTANTAYRRRAVQLVGWGLLAVFAVLLARYRSVRVALAAFLPAILSAGVTVAALALAGIPLNLMAITALLMVLSMGVDYGVFLVESVREDSTQSLRATALSLWVAWLTTVFGFGVLALSTHPAMRIIGLVAGVGVTASLVLAPVAPWLLARRGAAG